MKKILIFIPAFMVLTSAVMQAQNAAAPAAQPAATAGTTTTEVGGADPNAIGVDKAQQELKEISIYKMEDDGFWTGFIPRDDGFISLRKFEGSPADKQPIAGEDKVALKESDRYVLGAKIEHIHRAVTYFEIIPLRPIPMPGITKTISLWVVGRNVKHQLSVIVNDQFGNRAKIPMGDLAFTGWKKLTAAIPPNIRQSDPRYNNKQGITLEKFLVETDPAETYGSYYIYFDDIRTVTDLFSENNRDPDDIPDAW